MIRALNVFVAVFVVVALVAGCQTLTGKSSATVIDDPAITASVKTKLVADRAANLTRVDVDTNQGTVYLTGIVDSTEQRTRAGELARQAKGVKNVVNNLQVAQRR
jgi:hyperosmotically inducible periplasmic protein